MKLKEFLLKSNGNSPLDELKHLLQSNCKQTAQHMVNGSVPLLWRGFEVNDLMDLKTCHLQNSDLAVRYFISEKRTADRISRTGYNLLMRYIDLSREWGKFPKRSRSTICSTSLHHADSFGRAFLIIPFDNVSSFGTAPEDINMVPVINTTQFGDISTRITGVMRLFKKISDFVFSAGKLLKVRHNDIYQTIQTEFEKLEKSPLNGDGFNFSYMKELEYFCDSLDIVLAKFVSLKHDPNTSNLLPAQIRMGLHYWEDNDVFDTTAKIYPQLERIFSPETLSAKAVNSVSELSEQSREVWFQGDGLMIALYRNEFKRGPSSRENAIDILKELLE